MTYLSLTYYPRIDSLILETDCKKIQSEMIKCGIRYYLKETFKVRSQLIPFICSPYPIWAYKIQSKKKMKRILSEKN